MRSKCSDVLYANNVMPKYHTLGRVTVCTLFNRETLGIEARGLSICSPNDKFNVVQGRRRALWMAVGSLLARSHLEPIVPRRFHVIRDGHIIVGYAHLDKVRREFGYYKGVYQPTALDHEVRTTEKIRAQRAVKKAIDKPKHRYAQIFNPAVDRWVKVDAKLGGVVAYKKSKGEYKGIPIFEKDKSKKEEGEINAN